MESEQERGLEQLPKEGQDESEHTTTPATQMLRNHSIPYTEHHFQYVEKGGTGASSSSLNVPEHSVVKTLGKAFNILPCSFVGSFYDSLL